MGVAVVTDSAASLPAGLAAELGVTVVPLWLDLGGRAVQEGACSLDEVLAHPRPTTSGPSPGELARAVASRLGPGTDVVVVTLAASLSSTHQAAVLAARQVRDEAGLPPEAVQVVDTGTAAGAQGLVVLAAARAAASGAGAAEVAATARRVARRVRLVATVGSVDHLVRSGRVPGAAGWAGRRLGITPLFAFEGGRVRPLRPARGAEPARQRILRRWAATRPPGGVAHVAALHALDPAAADALLAGVAGEAPVAEAFVAGFGAAMVAHVGPGLSGLAWWWEGP